MTATMIIQSFPEDRPAWIDRCTASVARWAAARGFGYRAIGDALFDHLPNDWLDRAGPEKLPRTDYARLLWIRALHAVGVCRPIWVDADILVLDADMEVPGQDFLCREQWFYRRPGMIGALVRHAVNNCMMGFGTGSALLDWYVDACTRAPDAGPLDRLALGPMMLTARHANDPLPMIDRVATLSPLWINALLGGNRTLTDAFRASWRTPIQAVHLCRSLGHTADGPALVRPHLYAALIDRLERAGMTG